MITIEEKPVSNQEARRTQAVQVFRIELVSGEHLSNHLIVGKVVVKRFDDPVPPVPNEWVTISMLLAESPPVAVPPDIHPVPPPPLAIPWIVKQLVHELGVSLWCWIRRESSNFLWGGRHPEKVQIESADG